MSKPTKTRISSRNLIEIGQLWRRRKTREIVRVYQVHRKSGEALILPVEFVGIPAGRDLSRVKLTDLRRLYVLLSTPTEEVKDEPDPR